MRIAQPVMAALMIAISASGLASANPSVDTEIRQMEAESCPALLHNDQAALDRLFAADFLNVDPEGGIKDRKRVLADIPNYKLSHCTIDVSSVRKVGDMAVAIGTMTMDSPFYASSFRYTDVFVRRDGRWVLLTSHQSLIKAPPAKADGGK